MYGTLSMNLKKILSACPDNKYTFPFSGVVRPEHGTLTLLLLVWLMPGYFSVGQGDRAIVCAQYFKVAVSKLNGKSAVKDECEHD